MNKKDAYYFPHDSNAKRDPKMLMLRHQLGAEGYGLYWMLIEDLREQEDYVLPVQIIPALAKEYDTSTSKLETVIQGYGLFVVEDDIFFYSESLVKRMKNWDKKKAISRARAEKAAKARWNKVLAETTEDAQAVQVDSASNAQAMHKQCTSNAQVMQVYAKPMQSDAIREEERREEKKREDKHTIGACVSEISKYYSFSEISDFKKYREATQFCTLLHTNKQLEKFREQFAAYIEFKELTSEKRHRFANFIGTPQDQYLDGGWNSANWVDELSREKNKAKAKGKEGNGVPQDDKFLKEHLDRINQQRVAL